MVIIFAAQVVDTPAGNPAGNSNTCCTSRIVGNAGHWSVDTRGWR